MGFTLPLTYTRPKHVNSGSINQDRVSEDGSEAGQTAFSSSNGSIKSGRTTLPAGIPESLSFDKIINGATCPVSRILSMPYHNPSFSDA
jgi:hypothetical protein